MKLLLDTHIFLWSLLDPERLSSEVIRQLEEKKNELWISPVTTWEVLILAEKGRLELEEEAATWIGKVLQSVAFREAPLNHEIAIASRRLDLKHEDPADRFIAATAKVFDLVLVTADERLLASTQIALLPNR